MSAGSSPRCVLCRLEDLEDPGSTGLALATAAGMQDIFVVRRGGAVYGYLNRCPHTGGPLDWVPGRFLDIDRRYIQCATHDARFNISDGRCIAGPCAGDRLTAIPLVVEDGAVVYPGHGP